MATVNQRIRITKQLMREGLLRCLQTRPIEKITISELCRESGINRATFYHHYESPQDILLEIGWEYAEKIRDIFHAKAEQSLYLALTGCFTYLNEQRQTLKTILSAGADRYVAESVSEIFFWSWDHFIDLRSIIHLDEEEYQLIVNSLGWAAYHFVKDWILEDIPKSPEEIGNLLYRIMTPLAHWIDPAGQPLI